WMRTWLPRSSRYAPCSRTRPARPISVPAATRTSPRAWATWWWCLGRRRSSAGTGTTRAGHTDVAVAPARA
ncbi:MAG: hypothetical protein AVDCRST_MAG10-3659, partial [uncultured Acidimicrobiales bacterium]